MARSTLLNVTICLVVAIGSFTYGFGFGVFITAIGEPGFYVYFNLNPSESSTAKYGLPLMKTNDTDSSTSIIGGTHACFAAGRKRAIAAAGVWALVSGALTTGSVNITMLIPMRIIHGIGPGMMVCLVPLYITEVVCACAIFLGLTGTDHKVQWLKELRCDALNYKDPNLVKTFRNATEQLTDVFFDNVGGDMVDLVLSSAKPHVRIVM